MSFHIKLNCRTSSSRRWLRHGGLWEIWKGSESVRSWESLQMQFQMGLHDWSRYLIATKHLGDSGHYCPHLPQLIHKHLKVGCSWNQFNTCWHHICWKNGRWLLFTAVVLFVCRVKSSSFLHKWLQHECSDPTNASSRKIHCFQFLHHDGDESIKLLHVMRFMKQMCISLSSICIYVHSGKVTNSNGILDPKWRWISYWTPGIFQPAMSHPSPSTSQAMPLVPGL